MLLDNMETMETMETLIPVCFCARCRLQMKPACLVDMLLLQLYLICLLLLEGEDDGMCQFKLSLCNYFLYNAELNMSPGSCFCLHAD